MEKEYPVLEITNDFWKSNKELFYSGLYSPFSLSLCSGSLTKRDFEQYMAEESFIMNAIAEGYAIAQQYASEASSYILGELSLQLKKEVEDRKKKFEVCDLDLNSTLHKTALSYTKLILDTAELSQELGEKVTAVLLSLVCPWMKLFFALSEHFKTFVSRNNPSYSWIEKYASKDFEAYLFETELLFATSCETTMAGQSHSVTIRNYYSRGMELAIDFFFAQASSIGTALPLISEQGKTKFSIHVDLTCAIAANTDLDRGSISYMEGLVLDEEFEGFEQLLNIMIAPIPVEFCYGKVEQAFEHLLSWRRKSNESLDLAGIDIEEMKRAFREHFSVSSWFWKIYPKMLELRGDKGHVTVYSLYYCSDVIRGLFGAADFPRLGIVASDHTVQNGITTGEVTLCSPVLMAGLVALDGEADRCFTICIARGLNDLLCLLKADLGIVVRLDGAVEDVHLVEMAEHNGVKFLPLFAGVIERQQELFGEGSPKWNEDTIYTVDDWDELSAFIKALKNLT